MHGKVVVITGATSGIGAVAAERLAQQGARIVLVARDRARGAATLAHLEQIAPGLRHVAHYADLASIAQTRRVAADIAASERTIDVLMNNAGALYGGRRVSPDGLEMTFAVNHMAYFVMTEGLQHRLRESAPSRIVNTASGAHKRGAMDFADLQATKSYGSYAVYARSKLCNILFTRELARRLAGTGVTANCLHPGLVATRFGDAAGGATQLVFGAIKWLGISPEKGAETLVYLASSPEVAGLTGLYFEQCHPVTPSAKAQDDGDAARLWAESERLASGA